LHDHKYTVDCEIKVKKNLYQNGEKQWLNMTSGSTHARKSTTNVSTLNLLELSNIGGAISDRNHITPGIPSQSMAELPVLADPKVSLPDGYRSQLDYMGDGSVARNLAGVLSDKLFIEVRNAMSRNTTECEVKASTGVGSTNLPMGSWRITGGGVQIYDLAPSTVQGLTPSEFAQQKVIPAMDRSLSLYFGYMREAYPVILDLGNGLSVSGKMDTWLERPLPGV
jgi:hypothetical protein